MRHENFSDDTGMVKGNVSRVESTGNDQNTITRSLDTEKILAPLEGKNSYLFTSLKEKKISFSYTIPSFFSDYTQLALPKDQGIKELVANIINNIKTINDIPSFKAGCL